jgi:hypothetical protein
MGTLDEQLRRYFEEFSQRLAGQFLFFSPTFSSWKKVEEKNVGEKNVGEENKRDLPSEELSQSSTSKVM